MGMITVTELRSGRKIMLNGELFNVLSYQHHKPGKGRTVVRLRIKNIKNGSVQDKTMGHNEKVEEADMQTCNMQYLYAEGDSFIFMDLDSYEQHEVPKDLLGDTVNFLRPEAEAIVLLHDGAPIGVELPPKMDFEVVDTIEAVRGNTANNVTKDATLDTGFVVQVPLFIKKGERVRVRTEDGSYVERA